MLDNLLVSPFLLHNNMLTIPANKTKLLSFNSLSPLSALIDGLNQVLSTLILKAGHILDIFNEASKSIVYSNEHRANIRAGQAGKLVKSADFQVYTPIY